MFRFNLLRLVAKALLPEYRFKWPQMAWWKDRGFNDYLSRFDEQNGMNTDRRWMMYQLLRLTADVAGDTAECGVFNGAGSYLIANFNTNLQNSKSAEYKRNHCMFDSFAGLSEPSKVDGKFWKAGDMTCPEKQVGENLKNFNNLLFYPGWIPERFIEVEKKQFSFVHIDVDLFQPTFDSLQFFYPRMSVGGIILCDDYGFTSCPGATKACDDFFADKQEKIISLCSGGGFIIKGVQTGQNLIQ